MAVRAVIVFLAKVFPIFFLTLLVWQYLGLSRVYHAVIAGVLDTLYLAIDSTGLIDRVTTDGANFIVRFVPKGGDLRIVAGDITSNTAMLVSLYLASPIRFHPRRFASLFLASLLILFFAHCVTLAATIQYAFTTNPEIVRRLGYGMFRIKTVDAYVYFYEIIGMYLIVLALWFPYILMCVAGARRQREGQATSHSHKEKHPR